MVEMMRRMAEPVVRFTSVRKVEHERVFDVFADNLARTIVERRAHEKPRIVSLRPRTLQ
ncbi:hypothetical protein L1787_13725 [Acuticoccus sp. M5D2P5]|uniref:hypothetical protein n=1 Tax=Acuticoccus kalidii TaxID=2910977 RepID=UPI001F32E180|nr:hypothetical protein [Acuticoccus kalidii]MCF3934464.1 hypothetical protein [Acuticoccus kalidii]